MEIYPYIKSFHLIFVVTWFAGLFYIPRLFVYQIEAFDRPLPERDIIGAQLKIMAKRLWTIITWPSAILAIFFAIWLIILQPAWLEQRWMQVKLGFVFLLIVYHLKTHSYYLQLQKNRVRVTSSFMRIWNEGATFILFAVVFLAILKSAINWIFGILSLIILAGLIMLGYRIYRNIRMKKKH